MPKTNYYRTNHMVRDLHLLFHLIEIIPNGYEGVSIIPIRGSQSSEDLNNWRPLNTWLERGWKASQVHSSAVLLLPFSWKSSQGGQGYKINISICPIHKSWLSFCMVRGAKSHQSCLTLCDPDCSPPGPSVHGILQARILECVSMPCSRGSSPLTDWTCISLVSCIDRRVLYHQHHLGCPMLHGPVLKQAKHADMGQHPRTHVNFPFYLDNHIH